MSEDKLRESPLFRSMPPSQFGELLKVLRTSDLPDGEVLFREGDSGDRVYIILDGELDIISGFETPMERLAAVLGSGNIVGEMPLLVPDSKRTATVRAKGDVKLYELSLEDFEAVLVKSPIMGYRILQELGARLNRSYENLRAAQAELVQKEKLEHELSMARDIQQSILPQEIPHFMGVDLGAKMVPARAVGGDFYDFIPLDGQRLGVAIGDVSDKGVPAALFMAQFSTLLRLQARNIRSPRSVLNEINYHLLGVNQAGLFVTTIYGVFDTKSNMFTYARAGHEVPVLFDPEGNASEPEHGQGAPLGVFPEPPLDVQTVEVPPGHTLLMYTDGGTDAMNAEEDFFGLENLTKKIGTRLGEGCQALCDSVVDELVTFQQEDGQFDDITLVALHCLE